VAIKPFYGRRKIRLTDFRSVRSELCVVYRACVAQQLQWEDGRSAALILARIGGMDESAAFEARIAALETALAERAGHPNKPNGAGRHVGARP
jgi:hypothetical protein